MLDDFFSRAVIAGLGICCRHRGRLVVSLSGASLPYFGDTLAHAALLGVALSLLLNVNVTLAVFVMAAFIALALLALQKRSSLSSDALLGMLSHGSLAIGLLALAFMTWVRMDLMGLLFGDLLAVTPTDIAVIYAGGIAVLAAIIWAWKPLFAVTVNKDLAAAEGYNVAAYDVLLMLLLAAVVAVSIKIVGRHADHVAAHHSCRRSPPHFHRACYDGRACCCGWRARGDGRSVLHHCNSTHHQGLPL